MKTSKFKLKLKKKRFCHFHDYEKQYILAELQQTNKGLALPYIKKCSKCGKKTFGYQFINIV